MFDCIDVAEVKLCVCACVCTTAAQAGRISFFLFYCHCVSGDDASYNHLIFKMMCTQ